MLGHERPARDGEHMSARQIQIKTQAFIANLPMFQEMSAEELDRVAAATLPVAPSPAIAESSVDAVASVLPEARSTSCA